MEDFDPAFVLKERELRELILYCSDVLSNSIRLR